MTNGEIVLFSVLCSIGAGFTLLTIDILMSRHANRKRQKEQELFRRLYDQAISDSFRPKQ
jgi:hypothetical protein